MKKADMQAHREAYQALMGQARLAEREGLYTRTVELALSSWEHIDGMMQHGRRYEEKEFASIGSIDMVLKYAPLLLDFHSLDKLEGLLKNCRRIEKNTSASLAVKLSKARGLMWTAHRLWDHIERNPQARQDKLRGALGGDQDQWRSIASAWENMGLLQRTRGEGAYRLALSTRMGELVPAKCPSCGEIVEGPKAMFLEQIACSQCRTTVLFVILSAETPAGAKE